MLAGPLPPHPPTLANRVNVSFPHGFREAGRGSAAWAGGGLPGILEVARPTCFLSRVSGSKEWSRSLTGYPQKKPFMETELQSQAQGTPSCGDVSAKELSGTFSRGQCGPRSPPVILSSLSALLLSMVPGAGVAVGLLGAGSVCPLPPDFLGAVPAAPSVQSGPGAAQARSPPQPTPAAGDTGTAVSVARALGTQAPGRHSLGWPGAVLPSQARAGGGPASPWHLVCVVTCGGPRRGGRRHCKERGSQERCPRPAEDPGGQSRHRGAWAPVPGPRPHLLPCPVPP